MAETSCLPEWAHAAPVRLFRRVMTPGSQLALFATCYHGYHRQGETLLEATTGRSETSSGVGLSLRFPANWPGDRTTGRLGRTDNVALVHLPQRWFQWRPG